MSIRDVVLVGKDDGDVVARLVGGRALLFGGQSTGVAKIKAKG